MKSISGMILALAIATYGTPLLAAGDAAAGKAAYLKKCASCHGQEGEGKEAIAKAMKIEFKHLGSKEVQSKSDADLKKTAIEGAGKMKPVKDLDDKTTDDIVAYLRTLAKK